MVVMLFDIQQAVRENVDPNRIDDLIDSALWLSVAVLVIIIIGTIWVARIIAGHISKPITLLTENVKKIARGDLDYISEIKTGDEIEALSRGFENMTLDLKRYIENLGSVTAEKERIGAELNIATKIQASMLPRIFPPYPKRAEFDLYASMVPAREVGGDFYDFFLVDKNTLFFLAADVSGKGVPASLFMVITKTLIKNSAQNGLSPREVFEMVNNQLLENNEENMFVTSFMGCLDIPSGKMICVNAGHNPPLIKQEGQFKWLRIKHGLVLAGMKDMRYAEAEISLKSGDMIYLYTDGVTEAMNTEDELFGEDRLLAAAEKNKNANIKDLGLSIKKEIDDFTRGAEQADDITMLVLEYRGNIQWEELKLEAVLENLDAAVQFVDNILEKAGCSAKTQTKIDVAVEEIFVNIVNYAYAPAVGSVIIRFAVSENEVWLEFEDAGKPYNPLEKADPDIAAPLKSRPIGGLGIFIVKKTMDTVDYRYVEGKNILILKKNIEKE
jgi:sigma-B regulation protein RsbU (phosphoserine phosphatase)